MTALYTAKCFWPGVTEDDVRAAGARAASGPAAFRGAYLLPGDELVLAVFEAASASVARLAGEQAGMPCERIIEAVWIAPPAPDEKET